MRFYSDSRLSEGLLDVIIVFSIINSNLDSAITGRSGFEVIITNLSWEDLLSANQILDSNLISTAWKIQKV